MNEDGKMTSRTRPGTVPAHITEVTDELRDGLSALKTSALTDVIEGRAVYMAAEADREAPTIADRIDDLEAGQAAQERAHRGLEGVVDQLTAQVQELRRQLGMGEWRPEYRSERSS